RTHRGVLDATRVVEFILVDRLFPRSVIHALTTAEDCLNAIEGGREGRLGTRTEAQRLLGRARGELEFLAPGELLEDLQRRLLALQELGQAAGEAV
ncbi:alpha-E domain-containing protein, partial [Mycobacterium kansasii]